MSRAARTADGWYESWTTERELELLALPRNALLPHDALALRHDVRLDDVLLDGAKLVRVELARGPGTARELQLAEDAESRPADHVLLLVPELAARTGAGEKRNPAPVDELTQRCTVRFGGPRARLVGLALVSHRFVVRPPDLVVDPELARVDPDSLPLRVRRS